VCLEDSETHTTTRGRGIAPAAWCAIADALVSEGKQRMVTQVWVENKPTQRAVQKTGFDELAIMHYSRFGPLRRSSIEVLDPARAAFAAELFDAVSGVRVGTWQITPSRWPRRSPRSGHARAR
jgi:hypothetical protein